MTWGNEDMDLTESILKISAEKELSVLKQHVSHLAGHYGYDRSILFSISPLKEQFIDRIFWIEGQWPEGNTFDEKTYIERCPVNQHLLKTSQPFFWRKIAGNGTAAEYQVIDKPLRGALQGVQIPVFGSSGLEGAFSLGGNSIDSSPKATLVMRWLATETFFSARRILAAAATFSSARLTPREKQILRLVSSGLKHTEVAGLLEVSPRTVENHLRQIRHRLGVTTTPQAVRVAMISGELESAEQ